MKPKKKRLIPFLKFLLVLILLLALAALTLNVIMIREGKNSVGEILLHVLVLGWTLFITIILSFIPLLVEGSSFSGLS